MYCLTISGNSFPPSIIFANFCIIVYLVKIDEKNIKKIKRLINAGKMIGIELIDHVIVGSEVYLSLAEEKIVEF